MKKIVPYLIGLAILIALAIIGYVNYPQEEPVVVEPTTWNECKTP